MHTIWKFVESWPQDMIYVYIYSHRNIKVRSYKRSCMADRAENVERIICFLDWKLSKPWILIPRIWSRQKGDYNWGSCINAHGLSPLCLQQRPKTCFCSTIPGVFQLHWGEGVFWWFCCWQEMWHQPMFKLAVTWVKWHKTQWKKYLGANIQWKWNCFHHQ